MKAIILRILFDTRPGEWFFARLERVMDLGMDSELAIAVIPYRIKRRLGRR